MIAATITRLAAARTFRGLRIQSQEETLDRNGAMKAAELMVAHPGLLMVAAHTVGLRLHTAAADLDLRTEDVLHLLTVAAGPGRLTVDGRLLMAGAVQEGRQVVAEVVVTVVADTAAATRRVGAAEDIPVAADTPVAAVAGTAVATN